MSVSVSNFDHQENVKVLVTNIFRQNEKLNGNLLWEYNKKNNSFSEFGKTVNVNECGWPWGSQFIDLNNDSWDDLLIVNGMYGKSTKPSYWYNLSVLDSSGRSFMGDYKNWPSDEKFELDGNQKDCIFLNQPTKKSFVNVSKYFDDFDKDKKNGRALAYLDMNNNGNLALIVANQNDEAKIYDIIPTNQFKWIGLELKTSLHNSFPIGSTVYWGLSDDNHSFKEMRPIAGYMSQNDPRFRLAFPIDKTLKYLKIKWLDGVEQNIDLKNVKMNSYNTILREMK